MATMMLTITILGLSMGYIQSLRFDNQRKIEKLKKLGVVLSRETYWLGAPKEAEVDCRNNPQCGEILDMLEGMGVGRISAPHEDG
jgi:hypothetical protein